MGIFDRMFLAQRRVQRAKRRGDVSHANNPRPCRFEVMEERRMLNADPLVIGAVYIEEDLGSDLQGDTFEVTFRGGAAGTQLTQLIIDGDQQGDFGNLPGLSAGDVIFDTLESGSSLGADHAFPFTLKHVLSQDGTVKTNVTVKATVTDGGSQLVLDLTNVVAGDRLIFTIDADEVQDFNPANTSIPAINDGLDPLTSGAEFAGSLFKAHFKAQHYHDAVATTTFLNRYDDAFAQGNALLTSGELDLPADNDRGIRDRTAGALAHTLQTPKPITIAGTVFHDRDQDLQHEPSLGEHGIADVKLSLWYKNAGGQYEQVMRDGAPVTATTDNAGNYHFGEDWNLLPGYYQVRETQPADYSLSVGAIPGTVAGSATGSSLSSDVLTEIHIPLGDTDAVDYDFAEANPAELSGYVYHDRDHDGLREPGSNESGIANVTISLYDTTGKLVAETTTDSNGHYEFVGLRAGTYKVVETHPVGWIDGKDTVGSITSGGNTGIATEPDTISQITLLSGNQGTNYNFGERLGSLSGQVHVDLDGDCIVDPGEQPLAGVTITLEDQNGQRYTTVTDAHGRYEFKDLRAGTYTVREQQPTSYFNGHQTAGSGGGNDSVANVISNVVIGGNNVHLVNYNFCEELGSLSGYVYHDRDNDGLREPGQNEAPIAGVTLRLLDANGQPVRDAQGQPRTAVTDAQGHYRFDGLAPGIYTVAEVHPQSWIDGIDTPGVVNAGTPAQRATGQADGIDSLRQIQLTQSASELGSVHGENFNFGERLGTLSGHVYVDLDGDCVFDPEESSLAGVTIRLVGSNGQTYTTTTDAQGRYEFTGLATGTYTVIQEQPTGYFNGNQMAGTAGGDASVANRISQVILGGNDINLENYDFCEELGTLSGYVYHDQDNDGQRETTQGEEPIAGVTLRLVGANGQPVRDSQGQIRTAVTDANGFYKFEGLAPGVYTIEEVHPAGWIDGKDTPGTVSGKTSPPRATGQSDGGDRLRQIELTQQPTESGAVHGENYNFGEMKQTSIAGRVYADINGNCIFEPELMFGQPQQRERGLAGVTVRLRDSSGAIVATTVTNANGQYEFLNLRPGTYTVEEVQPADYFDIGQTAGNLGGDASQPNRITSVTLRSGDIGTDYDFCEAPPAVLSGYVFRDGQPIYSPTGQVPGDAHLIRDGVLTPDDLRLGGVILELRNGLDGSPIMGDAALPGIYGSGPIRVVTDAQGFYQFIGLPRGNYAVYEVQPAHYLDHIDTPGTTLGVAWNAHEAAPVSILTRMADNPPPQFDAILSIALGYGQSSELNNFSEVQVAMVPYIPETPRLPPSNIPPVELEPMPQVYLPPFVPPPERPNIPIYGAGGDLAFTWHLSVLDAGRPRGSHESSILSASAEWATSSLIMNNWHVNGLQDGKWTMTVFAEDGPQTFEYLFGLPGAKPLTGDFDGNGTSELAIFYRGEWFIDLNGNGQWDEEDLWAKLGDEHDQPVAGDWDGDGKDDIGIFGPIWPGDPNAIAQEPGLPDSKNFQRLKPKNMPPAPEEATSGFRVLRLTESGQPRADLIDHVFKYGDGGDIPVAGDWNGEGIDNIGVYQNGVWTLDSNGDGRLDKQDLQFQFGQEGDLPLVGDFNGDGVDEVGVYRAGHVMLDSNRDRKLDATDRVFELAGEGDLPVVGDFNADGIDEVGLYRDLSTGGGSISPVSGSASE